jgi:hypothetical protein
LVAPQNLSHVIDGQNKTASGHASWTLDSLTVIAEVAPHLPRPRSPPPADLSETGILNSASCFAEFLAAGNL